MKINYNKIEEWEWLCPCGCYNTEDLDPTSQDTLICENCGNKFEVGEEE